MEEMLEESVLKYMNPQLHVFNCMITISDAVKYMVENDIDSILISEDDTIIGIATNKDILKAIAADKDPKNTILKEITSKSIITIPQDAKIKDAISLMNKHDVRRLLVKNDVRPVGVISRKQIVGNMGKFSIVLPELERPNGIRCPYCSSIFPDKNSMSRHIDDIHIGKGILEGNLKDRDF